jgi:hypothetical protein
MFVKISGFAGEILLKITQDGKIHGSWWKHRTDSFYRDLLSNAKSY